MLAALKAYDRLAPDSDVRAWLVTIAHRKAVDVLRAGNRAALPVAELPEEHSRHGLPGRRDLDLWAALATLPERQRFAVVQHHLGGLPFAQVAELTGGSADAARKAASDGVHRLRTLLSEKEDRS
jgi:RNA polymerase sigma factor (sigma-70 family)